MIRFLLLLVALCLIIPATSQAATAAITDLSSQGPGTVTISGSNLLQLDKVRIATNQETIVYGRVGTARASLTPADVTINWNATSIVVSTDTRLTGKLLLSATATDTSSAANRGNVLYREQLWIHADIASVTSPAQEEILITGSGLQDIPHIFLEDENADQYKISSPQSAGPNAKAVEILAWTNTQIRFTDTRIGGETIDNVITSSSPQLANGAIGSLTDLGLFVAGPPASAAEINSVYKPTQTSVTVEGLGLDQADGIRVSLDGGGNIDYARSPGWTDTSATITDPALDGKIVTGVSLIANNAVLVDKPQANAGFVTGAEYIIGTSYIGSPYDSSQIVRTDLDGSNKIQLTNDPNYSYGSGGPTWSADGAQIAAVRYNGSNNTLEAVTMNADGSGLVVISDNGPTDSVESSTIQYLGYDQIVFVMNSRLYKAAADGSSLTLLDATTGYQGNPTGSILGDKIVAHRQTGGGNTYQLVLMDADGTNQQVIVSNNDGQPYYRLLYSYDGNNVFYQLYDGANVRIMQYNVLTGTNTALSPPGMDAFNFVLSPHGDEVGYICAFGASYDYELCSSNVDGTEDIILTSGIEGVYGDRVLFGPGNFWYTYGFDTTFTFGLYKSATVNGPTQPAERVSTLPYGDVTVPMLWGRSTV